MKIEALVVFVTLVGAIISAVSYLMGSTKRRTEAGRESGVGMVDGDVDLGLRPLEASRRDASPDGDHDSGGDLGGADD